LTLLECCIKDRTIGEEYAKLFPLGFTLVKDVKLPLNRFKRSPLEIIYHPFSIEHVNKIKTRITIYNKFDTKVPIFAILEDLERPNSISPHRPRKWEDIHNLQVLILDGEHTQLWLQILVSFILHYIIYFFIIYLIIDNVFMLFKNWWRTPT
jgi:hypothetical protein